MAQTCGRPTNCKPVHKTKGRFGKAPLTANPHNHKASNPAATTGGNRGQTNISETGPRYAAVVAEGFAASCPTTEWTPTSDKSTTRPGAPLYAAVVAARLPNNHLTYPHAPATDATQVPSTKEAPTTTTACPVRASSVPVNTLPAAATRCAAPAFSTNLPSVQDMMREIDCLKRQLEEHKKCAEVAANEAVDELLAVISERDTAETKLKDMSDIAVILEADLQKATAAAKEAAARKAQDDAQADERQQALEAQVAELKEKLAAKDKKLAAKDEHLAAKDKQARSAASAHKKELAKVQKEAARLPSALAEPARVQALEAKVVELTEQLAAKGAQAQSMASAHKEELTKVQQEAARLPGALAECCRLRKDLGASNADLAAALQNNTGLNKELQEEQQRSSRLHAFANTQVIKMEALRHEKVAAEGRAALAVSEKVESERAAAEKLQVARRRNEDLAGTLRREQENAGDLESSEAMVVIRRESPEMDLVAAQQSKPLKMKAISLGERGATQQLQAAHQELAAMTQEVMDLEAAREDAEEQAASATRQAASERAQCRWIRVRLGEERERAEAAEDKAALAVREKEDIECAAAKQLQAAHDELAATEQGRIPALLAELSAKENTIADLQGRLMEPSAADASLTSAAPEDPAQSASLPDTTPSAPATADDITPAISASASNHSGPATAAEDATSAASEAPRDSFTSLAHPRGPALPSLPEEAPTRSMAPKGFSLLKKIAAVSSGLLSIAAADVKGWQALQASR